MPRYPCYINNLNKIGLNFAEAKRHREVFTLRTADFLTPERVINVATILASNPFEEMLIIKYNLLVIILGNLYSKVERENNIHTPEYCSW